MIRGWAAVLLGLALAAPGVAAAPAPHHDIEVRLDPADRRLVVTDRLRISGGGPTAFRLGQGFELTGLAVDGRPTDPGRSGDRVWVDLGRDGEHEVVFDYRGRLAPLPEEPRFRGETGAVADPRGSFLPGFAGWYPVTADGSRFTYRVAVEVPEPQRAVVPGRLVAESTSGGRYRAVFVGEAPADDITLIAGPYEVAERFLDGIRLRAYFDPSIAAMAGEYLDLAAGYIDRYGESIGDYPFSGFSIVSGPLPVGLGFPGLTYIGTRVLRLPFVRDRSLGHEVLHSWWGNGVAVDYRTGNWAEGLTTYMADYAYAGDRSPAEAQRMRLGWLRDYAALPEERDRPAVEFVANLHQASQVIGYNKVALVFHMLRAELGGPAFDSGLRRFWKRWKFRTAGWNHLRRAFEDASGRDLGGFFDQWLRRAGAPLLRLGPVEVARRQGGYRIVLTLAQDSPTYDLKVPVSVTTEAGERRFTVAIEGPESRHPIDVEARPLALAVDPGFDLFRRLDPSEAPPILRDATLDRATVTVIAAGDPAARAAARDLAGRLLDTPPRFAATATDLPPGPLLVVGTSAEVATLLAAAGLPGVPQPLAGRGTARVWAGRPAGGAALVVVAAADAGSLAALLRPLPHYGGMGYLVFEGSKALDKGVWPSAGGPLRVSLE